MKSGSAQASVQQRLITAPVVTNYATDTNAANVSFDLENWDEEWDTSWAEEGAVSEEFYCKVIHP